MIAIPVALLICIPVCILYLYGTLQSNTVYQIIFISFVFQIIKKYRSFCLVKKLFQLLGYALICFDDHADFHVLTDRKDAYH